MRKKIIFLFITFILLLSAMPMCTVHGQTIMSSSLPTTNSTLPASDGNQSQEQCWGNLTDYCRQLGYFDNNITSITPLALNQALNAYLENNSQLELSAEPMTLAGSQELTFNSSVGADSSISNSLYSGSNLSLPLEFSNQTIISGESTFASQSSNTIVQSEDTLTAGSSPESKACVIIACWDYQFSTENNQYFENTYNNLLAWVKYGDYNQVYTLTNDDASETNIISTIQTAVNSYQEVDLYFIGHGDYAKFELDPITNLWWSASCYWPEDASYYNYLGWDWTYYSNEVIWAPFFISNTEPFNTDLSSLRLTCTIACDAAVDSSYSSSQPDQYSDFPYYTVFNMNGAEIHPRACIAASGPVDCRYTESYMALWCQYFYLNQLDSASAANLASENAGSAYGSCPLSYFDNGASFTCDQNFVSSETNYNTPDSANVYNADGVIGPEPDGYFATLTTTLPTDLAFIDATTYSEATGQVYLWADPYTAVNLTVYVSIDNNNNDWTQICSRVLPAPNNFEWIDCGSFSGVFNYVGIVLDGSSNTQWLYINSVSLQPYHSLADVNDDRQVNFHDISYFVANYINYYTNGIYNPYIDLDSNGVINFHDISLFVANYIAYYTTNDLQPVGEGGSLGLGSGQDDSGQTAALSLNGPTVLPSVGSSFNVTLNVNNVAGLWSWGTGATWNPSVLALTNITEGPFLQSGGSTMFLNSLGDPLVLSNGVLRDMGDALLSSSTVSGSGTIATLTFQVLSNAPVNITLTGSELDSPDTGNGIQVIPCTTNNLQIQPLPPPTGNFVAVQQGTTNQYWSIGPNPNPLNTTIGVDVSISYASNVWGWSIPNVSWNPRILQLTQVTEGSFLADNTGGNPTVIAGNSPSSFDNVHGTIMGGLSGEIQGDGTSIGSSGVVATLWFNVTGNGIADIDLSGAKLYASSIDNVGTNTSAWNGTVTVNTPSNYIFSDGFESGDFSMWRLAYGEPLSEGPQISSAEAHTGKYSAYFPAESAQGCNFAYLGTDFSPQSTLNFRFYIYLTAKSGNGWFDQLTDVDANNGDQLGIGMNLAAGQFEVWYYNNNYDGCYTYESSTQNVTANSWFCLELALTPTTFTLYYNGASIVTSTFPDGPTGQFCDANIEPFAYPSALPAFYIDDVIVSTSYIGP